MDHGPQTVATAEQCVADEILATLTGLFGGALLTLATLSGAFMWRRIQELRDRMRDLEARLEKLRPYEEALEVKVGPIAKRAASRRKDGA